MTIQVVFGAELFVANVTLESRLSVNSLVSTQARFCFQFHSTLLTLIGSEFAVGLPMDGQIVSLVPSISTIAQIAIERSVGGFVRLFVLGQMTTALECRPAHVALISSFVRMDLASVSVQL